MYRNITSKDRIHPSATKGSVVPAKSLGSIVLNCTYTSSCRPLWALPVCCSRSRAIPSSIRVAASGSGDGAGAFSNRLSKIQTHGREKLENGICHDDSVPPVKAKTIDELHSLQKKRSAPTTPIKDGAQQGNAAFATILEEERQKLHLQSIRTRILEAPKPRLKNPPAAEEPKKNKKIIVEDEIDVKYKSFKKFDTVKEHSDHYFSIPEHLDGVPSYREIKPSKNWAKRIQLEWKLLEKDLPGKIILF
ncbi:hypothetical protein ZIOFF_043722 [Zingiber officinale]|uniref:Uncharacterized protein n=1 Tax=Zingiber officinale TaxID=94328 RepID=A0A8J5FZU2_ZINOF|nr:hypothetical protein ZIOFF_043722 [Zingiber officinale]